MAFTTEGFLEVAIYISNIDNNIYNIYIYIYIYIYICIYLRINNNRQQTSETSVLLIVHNTQRLKIMLEHC